MATAPVPASFATALGSNPSGSASRTLSEGGFLVEELSERRPQRQLILTEGHNPCLGLPSPVVDSGNIEPWKYFITSRMGWSSRRGGGQGGPGRAKWQPGGRPAGRAKWQPGRRAGAGAGGPVSGGSHRRTVRLNKKDDPDQGEDGPGVGNRSGPDP